MLPVSLPLRTCCQPQPLALSTVPNTLQWLQAAVHSLPALVMLSHDQRTCQAGHWLLLRV